MLFLHQLLALSIWTPLLQSQPVKAQQPGQGVVDKDQSSLPQVLGGLTLVGGTAAALASGYFEFQRDARAQRGRLPELVQRTKSEAVPRHPWRFRNNLVICMEEVQCESSIFHPSNLSTLHPSTCPIQSSSSSDTTKEWSDWLAIRSHRAADGNQRVVRLGKDHETFETAKQNTVKIAQDLAQQREQSPAVDDGHMYKSRTDARSGGFHPFRNAWDDVKAVVGGSVNRVGSEQQQQQQRQSPGSSLPSFGEPVFAGGANFRPIGAP
ncbi:MAG: hypothetical protein M1816_007766 [Peltula sp. TS41687]|nr:MAG: hypothetical protein M1816_007766 [Peltula sp. TS41687]